MTAQHASEHTGYQADGCAGLEHFHAFAARAAGNAQCQSAQLDRLLASPLLAQAWADAIVRFWDAGVAGGGIDPAEPLYLFDLAPGQGHCAWLLMRALQRRLGQRDLKPCYVACNSQTAQAGQPGQLDALLAHPALQPYAESGWFDTASWRGDRMLQLRRRGTVLLSTCNPVVVLGRGWLRTLPSELYGAHYGKAMTGWVKAPAQTQNSGPLEYGWDALDASALPPATQRLFAHYLARFNSSSFLFPAAAWQMLETLTRLSAGRYLLLSADYGCWSEQQVRLGALHPPCEESAGTTLPVNYHALSFLQQDQGAQVWNRQLDDHGFVLHAAWRDDRCRPQQEAWQGILGVLDATHPDETAQLPDLLAAASAPAASSVLTLLRRSGHDPRVLECGVPAMLQQAAQLSDSAYAAWKSALRKTWDNYFVTDGADPFCFQAGLLAIQLGEWMLARECFALAVRQAGECADLLHALAFIETATGNTALGAQIAARALACEPNHAASLALHAEIARRQQRWQTTHWYTQSIVDDGLLLEPLGAEHAGNFFHQYRDAQIAAMARMPTLDSLEAVQNWIDKQAHDKTCAVYAVMHRDLGFVGMVSMQYAAQAGYFCFWIGTDFQGQGLGQRAARLAFRQMSACGIAELFTSLYPDNLRSRKALASLGFSEMPVRIQPPDDELVFLWKSLADTTAAATPECRTARLAALCTVIDGPVVFHDQE